METFGDPKEAQCQIEKAAFDRAIAKDEKLLRACEKEDRGQS